MISFNFKFEGTHSNVQFAIFKCNHSVSALTVYTGRAIVKSDQRKQQQHVHNSIKNIHLKKSYT